MGQSRKGWDEEEAADEGVDDGQQSGGSSESEEVGALLFP